MLDAAPYKQMIRRNAKYIRLSINSEGQIVISTPYKLSDKKSKSIIKANQSWLDEQLHKYESSKQARVLPEQISFPSIDKVWSIHYQPSEKRAKLMQVNEHELIIYGDYQYEHVVKLLKKWMLQIGKMHLYPWLRNVSQRIELPFQSIVAGNHKTQWGSCSHDKVISLNATMLFLPPHLVEHVFIHELCHTIHLDHSKAFWALVAKHDPNWRSYKKKIKLADEYLPNWLR